MNPEIVERAYAQVGDAALRKSDPLEAARLWGHLVDFCRVSAHLRAAMGYPSDVEAIGRFEEAARMRRDTNYKDAAHGIDEFGRHIKP